MTFGLDYVSGPSPADLVAAGVTFVCRYLSEVNPATQVKLLTPTEAGALSQAGISLVSNYEWYANRSLEGLPAGKADAQIAAQQHAACGGPASRPIYFSVDVDTDGASVEAYFKGVASVIGLARTGAYGSYRVLKYLFDASAITWGWQTYAWSYGAWEPRAHIQQYQNGASLSGHSVDYDRSMQSDFGQWRVGGGDTPMSGTPANWHDDGTTLTATNGVKIVLGFREYVLASNWDEGNVPLAPQYYTQQLEQANPDLGPGDQIVFRDGDMLGYPHNPVGAMTPLKNKVVREWAGVELNTTRDLLAKYYSKCDTLGTQLSQAQAQLAEEQKQSKLLAEELGQHPDIGAVANRLQAIILALKPAADSVAEAENLAAQPIVTAASAAPSP